MIQIIVLVLVISWVGLSIWNWSAVKEFGKVSIIILITTFTLTTLMHLTIKYLPDTQAFLLDKDKKYNVALISAMIAGISLLYNRNENERKRLLEEKRYLSEQQKYKHSLELNLKREKYANLIQSTSRYVNEANIIIQMYGSITDYCLAMLDARCEKEGKEPISQLLTIKSEKLSLKDILILKHESKTRSSHEYQARLEALDKSGRLEESITSLNNSLVNKLEEPYLVSLSLLYESDELHLKNSLTNLHSMLKEIPKHTKKNLELSHTNLEGGWRNMKNRYDSLYSEMDKFSQDFSKLMEVKQKEMYEEKQENLRS